MISVDPFSRLSKIQEYINTIIENFNNIEITNKGSEVIIPVVYGGEYGPDLDKVAKHCDLSIEEVIKKHSNEGDLIVDTFLGGGTTAIACKATNGIIPL